MKRKLFKIILFVCLLLPAFVLMGCSDKMVIETTEEVYHSARVSWETLKNVERKQPEVKNGGLSRYPQYNVSLSGATTEEKQAILDESFAFYDYDEMDEFGNLFKEGKPVANEKYKKLFKHSASDALFGEKIEDSAPAVAKKVYIQPASIGNNITGLYAAPGEIITIILNDSDAERKMRVDIGQGSARGGSVNIPVGRDYNRMPVLRKSMRLNKTVNYVGSPLGGPIYIHNEGDVKDRTKPYEITIIGAVEMPTYIVGRTSNEEWERVRLTPGTLFDFEVYAGVRFTMPASKVRKMSAEEVQKMGTFWENAAYLSNRVAKASWYSTHPITMIYDTYVPAGAAVAFVGADFCSLPVSWADNAINYPQMMISGGWGNLHEFNHHHQGWGSGGGGEVTNNVINSLTYMLFTNIGAGRTESGGLGGWNWVTSAYSSLNATLAKAGQSANHDLSTYIDIAHTFGEKVFFDLGATDNADAWFKAISKSTGYDMTYYLRDLCNQIISQEALNEIKALSLPMFVPVASLYQSGRTIKAKSGETVDVSMGKPFYISLGEDKQIDFNKYFAVPSNINYEIVNVTKPTYGTLVRGENNVFTYTPSKSISANADSFRVKLKLTEKSNAFKIDDVELILSFMQDGNGSDVKVWDNPGYSDIDTAMSEGLFNKEPKETYEFSYPGYMNNLGNTFTTVTGKIAFKKDTSATFYVKGDDIVYVYGGKDKNKLDKVATVSEFLGNYDQTKPNTYFSLSLKANEEWHYKMYVFNKGGQGSCRIGWKDPSLVEGAPPESKQSSSDSKAETKDAAAEIPIVDLPSSYGFKEAADVNALGKSDVKAVRTYYKPVTADALILNDMSSAVVSKAPNIYGNHTSNFMVDGNMSTMFHSEVKAYENHEIVVDLGKEVSFNTLRVYGRTDGNSAGRIKDYEISTAVVLADGFKLLNKGVGDNAVLGINLRKAGQKARYIKLNVTSQHGSQNYIAISEIQVGDSLTTSTISTSRSSDLEYSGEWNKNTYGPFINGYVNETSKGSVKVTFQGTAVALFSAKNKVYGNALVKLDGGEWKSVSLYANNLSANNAVYLAADLPDGKHTIEVKADKNSLINIEYFAFNKTAAIRVPKGLGGWLVVIIIASCVLAAGVGVGIFFLVKNFMKTKRSAK